MIQTFKKGCDKKNAQLLQNLLILKCIFTLWGIQFYIGIGLFPPPSLSFFSLILKESMR